MFRKPTYSLHRNTLYAINGLSEVTRSEASFRRQILMFAVLGITAWALPVTLICSIILFGSLFIPIMAELANSAIERTVDLVTLEYHELAKRAKDAGAALVFISLVTTAFVWGATLFYSFGR